MSYITTTIGKIQVKETVEEIFKKFNSEIYIELTEITTAKYQNKIYVLRESIIILEH